MKKIVLLSLIALALCAFPTNMRADNVCHAIGEATTTENMPRSGSRNSSFQMIFTKEELLAAGVQQGYIDGIKFNWSGSVVTYSKDLYIYMASTAKSVFADGDDCEPAATFTTARGYYYHEIPWSTINGEITYTFNSPFVWDGNSNIVIAAMVNGRSGNNERINFTALGSNCGSNRCIWEQGDRNTDIFHVGHFSFGHLSTFRPAISFCQDNSACPSVRFALPRVSFTDATISWDACASCTNGFDVVCSKSQITDFSTVTPQHITTNSIDLTGLDEYTDYYVYVRSCCGTYSAWSEALHFKTFLDCSGPRNVAITDVQRHRMTLNWTTKASISSYDIILSTTALTDPSSAPITCNVAGTSSSKEFTNLQRETTYYLYIRANCIDQNSSDWLGVSATTLPLECKGTLHDILADGEKDGDQLPFYGYSFYDPYTSQSIYPESMLTDLVGTEISGLKYFVQWISPYYNGALEDLNNIQFNIKMMTTSQTTLSGGLISTTDATSVYTGKLTVNTTNGMVIGLTTPFKYNGGNLLIEFELLTTISCGRDCDFYYADFDEDVSYVQSGFSNISGPKKILPKVEFTHCGFNPCPALESAPVASDITSNSATITWNAGPEGNASSYDMIVSLNPISDFTNVQPTHPGITTTSRNLTGLNTNTQYFVYIRANCTNGDESDGTSLWSPAGQFRTPKNITGITSFAITDPTMVVGNLNFDDEHHQISAVVAEETDLTTIPFTFTLADNTCVAKVGEQQLASPGTWDFTEPVTVRVYAEDITVYEDWEITIIEVPCPAPKNFTVGQITSSNSAQLSWKQNGSIRTWRIYGAQDNAIEVNSSNCTVNGRLYSYTLTGLTPNADYTLRFQGICGEDESSNLYAAEQPQFHTLNNAIGITSFKITDATVVGNVNIDAANHKIKAVVAEGTSLDNIQFELTLADGCTAKVGDAEFTSPQDFTYPVAIQLYAEDSNISPQEWTIIIANETCTTPYNLGVVNIAERNATLNWSIKDNTATSFDLVVSKEQLADPSTGTVQDIIFPGNAGTRTQQLSPLAPNTHYYIYIRTDCGTETSRWSSVEFNTHPVFDCNIQNTVVVAEVTINNDVINAFPVFAAQCNNKQKTQSIYSASMLTGLVGKKISKLKYFVGKTGSNSISSGHGSFNIKLMTTNQSTFSSGFVSTTNATLVYSGTLSASTSNDMVIELSTPFIYTGDNLLIEFELPTRGSSTNPSACNFYCIKPSDYVSCLSLDDGQPTSYKYLPKVEFSTCEEVVVCPAITAAPDASEVKHNSATITWNEGAGEHLSSYDMIVSETAITDFTGATPAHQGITVTSYNLTSLNPNTQYYVYVRANCTADGVDDGSSQWSPVCSFRTLNNVTGITNFEITSATVIDDVTIDSETHNISAKVLDDANLNSLAFTYTLADATCIAKVGDDNFQSPGNFTTPVTVRVYAEDTEVFEDWTITIEKDPCPAPKNFAVGQNITSTSVPLSWKQIGTDISWKIHVTPGDGVVDVSDCQIAGNQVSYTLTGLTPNTNYTLQLRASGSKCPDGVFAAEQPSFRTLNNVTGIASFSLDDDVVVGDVIIDATNHTISAATRYGTDLSNIAFTLTLADNRGDVTKDNGEPLPSSLDFTTQVTVVVYAEDRAVSQNWTISIKEYPCPAPESFAVGQITSSSAQLSWTQHGSIDTWKIYGAGDDAIVVSSSDCQIAGNQVSYTLTGLTPNTNYTLQLWASGSKCPEGVFAAEQPSFRTLNNVTGIASFSLDDDVVVGDVIIDATNHRISVTTRYGTDLSNLAFTLTLEDSEYGIAKVGEQEFIGSWNFTSTVIVTVYAEDRSISQDWTISIVNETCASPNNLNVTDIDKRTATLNWNVNDNTATSFDLVVSKEQLDDPSTGDVQDINFPSNAGVCTHTLSPLTPDAHYYVYIRTDCGNEFSHWSFVEFNTMPVLDCNNTDAIVVAEGTVGNDQFPVYGSFCDNSQKTQSIYLAPMLTDLMGNRISKLKYFVKKGGSSFSVGNWENATFKIRMMTTNETNLSSGFVSTADATEVYSGTLRANVQNGMEITLDEPFDYTGGNLLIEFELPTSTGWSYCYFYGIEAGGNVSYILCGPYRPEQSTFLPKVEFTTCEKVSACPALSAAPVASDVTSNAATITWNAGTGDHVSTYDIIVSNEEINDFTNITTHNTSDISYNLTSLSPETQYYVYVRVNCNADGYDDGSSLWSPACVFITDPVCTAPENFAAEAQSSTTARLTWTKRGGAESWRIHVAPDNRTVDVNSDNDDCQIDGGKVSYTLTGLSPNTQYSLQLQSIYGDECSADLYADEQPSFRTLNDEKGIASFSLDGDVVVGDVTIDDASHTISVTTRYGTDLSSIAFTLTLEDSEYGIAKVGEQEFIGSWNFTSTVIVTVYAEDRSISQDWTISIVNETCASPYNLNVTDIDKRTATLNWNVNDNTATSFDLVVSKESLDPSTIASWQNITVTNDAGVCTHTLSHLTPDTHYYVYIRTDCGNNEVSRWSSVEFNTMSVLDCNNMQSVVVEEGTVGNEKFPVYGYYCDFSQRTQSIYPASILKGLLGNKIKELKYFVQSGGSSDYNRNWENATFNIRMMNTDQSTLSGFIATTNATLVYSGTLTANTTDGMVIELTTPFEYSGGNLLIEFELPTSTGWSRCFFYGIEADGNVSNLQYSSISSPSRFLPKVEFTTCEKVSACPEVTDVAATNVDESSATITWTASTGTYANTSDIYYSTTEVEDFTGIEPQVTGITGTSRQITSLAPYTTYYVYVRTHCDKDNYDDGISGWAKASFRTLPLCRIPGSLTPTVTGKHTATVAWTNTSGGSQTDNFTYILSTTPVAEDALETTATTATGVNATSVDLTNLQSETTYYFYLKNVCTDVNCSSPWISCQFTTPIAMPAVINLQVHDIAHNAFTATWESDLANFANETEWEVACVAHGTQPTTWTQVSVPEYLALGLTPSTTYDFYVRATDDSNHSANTLIMVSTITAPAEQGCIDVNYLKVDNITNNTARAHWYPGNTETTWHVYNSTTEMTYDALDALTSSDYSEVTDNPEYDISGLNPNNDYYLYVRAVCGNDDGKSKWREYSYATPLLCSAPTEAVAYSQTDNSITFTATAGEVGKVGSYDYRYWVAGAESSAVTVPGGETHTVNGLAADNTYEWEVRANCSGNEGSSRWVKGNAVKVCGTVYLPWHSNFDQCDEGSVPDCWSVLEGGDDENYVTIKDWGSNVLSFYGASSVATPRFNFPAGDYDITMNLYSYYGCSGQMKVMFATDLSDESSFTTIHTIDLSLYENFDATLPLHFDAETTGYIVLSKTNSNYCNSTLYYLNIESAAVDDDCGEFVAGYEGDFEDAPVYSNYDASYTIQIYTADELIDQGYQAGDISSIAFYQTECRGSVEDKYRKNTTVWMGNTTKESFANDNDWITGLTKVMDEKPVDFNKNGDWVDLPLDNGKTFYWDGGSNLAVAVLAYSDKYCGMSFRGGKAGDEYRTIVTYQDDYEPTGGSGVPSMWYQELSSYHANIKLCYAPGICPAVTGITVDDITTTSATARWTAGENVSIWHVYNSPTKLTNAELAALDQTQQYTVVNTNPEISFNNLIKDTDYYLYVRASCSADEVSHWRYYKYSTLPTCSAPAEAIATSESDNSIKFTVNPGDVGTVGTYDYRYWIAGSNDIVTESGKTSPFTVSGLSGDKDYEWEVRANCSGTDEGSSRWVKGNTVHVCGVLTLPYFNDFEQYENYSVPNCWTVTEEREDEYDDFLTYPSVLIMDSRAVAFSDCSAIATPLINVPTEGLRISFKLYKYADDARMKVMFTTDLRTFTDIATLDCFSYCEDKIVSFEPGAATTGYIVFQQIDSYYDEQYALDNLLIEAMPTSNTKNVTVDNVTYTISGLLESNDVTIEKVTFNENDLTEADFDITYKYLGIIYYLNYKHKLDLPTTLTDVIKDRYKVVGIKANAFDYITLTNNVRVNVPWGVSVVNVDDTHAPGNENIVMKLVGNSMLYDGKNCFASEAYKVNLCDGATLEQRPLDDEEQFLQISCPAVEESEIGDNTGVFRAFTGARLSCPEGSVIETDASDKNMLEAYLNADEVTIDVNRLSKIRIAETAKNVVLDNFVDKYCEEVMFGADLVGRTYPECSAVTNITLDRSAEVKAEFALDNKEYYYFSLPFDCKLEDIKVMAGTDVVERSNSIDEAINSEDLATHHYVLFEWDESAYTSDETTGYVELEADVTMLEKNKGYVIAIVESVEWYDTYWNVDGASLNVTATFTASDDYKQIASSESEVEIPVTRADAANAYSGWNLVGNPFYGSVLSSQYSFNKYVRKVVRDNGIKPEIGDYASEIPVFNEPIRPFETVFIQKSDAAGDGTVTVTGSPVQKVQGAPAILPEYVTITLNDSSRMIDRTTIINDVLSSDGFLQEEDLLKSHQSSNEIYTQYGDFDFSFSEMNITDADKTIPLAVKVAAEGDYTIAMSSELSNYPAGYVFLHDKTLETYMKVSDGEVETLHLTEGVTEGRLEIVIKVDEVIVEPDNTEDVSEGGIAVYVHDGIATIEGIEVGAMVTIVDATGKTLYMSEATGNRMDYQFAVRGVYMITVRNNANVNTMKVVY